MCGAFVCVRVWCICACVGVSVVSTVLNPMFWFCCRFADLFIDPATFEFKTDRNYMYCYCVGSDSFCDGLPLNDGRSRGGVTWSRGGVTWSHGGEGFPGAG